MEKLLYCKMPLQIAMKPHKSLLNSVLSYNMSSIVNPVAYNIPLIAKIISGNTVVFI